MTPTRLSACACLFLGAGLVGLSQAEPRLMRDGQEDQSGAVSLKFHPHSPALKVSVDESQARKRTRHQAASLPGAWLNGLQVSDERHAAPKGSVLPVAHSTLPNWDRDLRLGDARTPAPSLLYSPSGTPVSLSRTDITRPADTGVIAGRAKYPGHLTHRFTNIWDFIRGCLRAPDSHLA